MAVNLTSADGVLKSYYLDAVSEQLNGKVNPFLSLIKKTSDNVWGKEVKQLAIYGMNGGIGAGSEDGSLPTARGNNYAQLTSVLKNLYGTIEISDKALKASANNTGAFVSLLNTEMDGLIKSSAYNFGRMLFGNGSGLIVNVVDNEGNNVFSIGETVAVMEGMVVDFVSGGQILSSFSGREIIAVDRQNALITLGGETISASVPNGTYLVMHGSYNKELTGLDAIFNDEVTELYGLSKATNPWLCPYVRDCEGEITEGDMQLVIDRMEEAGGAPDIILTSYGTRRALLSMFANNRHSIDTLDLAGGFKAISFNGIPVVADKFCTPSTMYFLNSKDFALHQLCDWQWLEGDDGKILRQVPGKPVYTATLVKYAELMCSRPYAQGAVVGITEI